MAYRAEIEIGVRGTEKLRELKTTLDDLSKRVNKLDELANTFQAPIQSVLNYTKAVQEATRALDKAELGSRDEADAVRTLARAMAEENAVRQRKLFLIDTEIRKQRGLLRPAPVSGTIELGPGGPGFSGGFTASQRQQANEQAILRIRQEEGKLRRENLILLNREEQTERRIAEILQRRTKTREAASNAIIGGAFPLLFGQGPGAALGGGLGGAAGGALGGQLGFGLSLVGTAAGAAFDQAITSAQNFAKALQGTGDGAQFLEERLGRLDPAIKQQIQNLQQSGQTAAAAELTFRTLADQIGTENAQAFLDLGKATDNFSVGFQRLVAFLIAGTARVSEAVLPVFEKLLPAIEGIKAFGGFVGGLAPTATPTARTPEATGRVNELARSNEILRLQVQLTAVSAKNDLDRYITISRTIAQQEYQNELTKIANQLKKGSLDFEEAILRKKEAQSNLDIKLGNLERERLQEVQRRQEEIARAAEEAARKAEQARQEAIQSYQKQLDLQNRIYSLGSDQDKLTIERAKLTQPELDALNFENAAQQSIYETQVKILENQRKSELASAKPYELALINQYYDEQLKTLEFQYELDLDRRELRRQEIQDRQALLVLELQRAATLPSVYNPVEEQKAAIDSLIEKYPALGAAADAASGLITSGFAEIISGTKSVEQVFADFLRNIANSLLQAAQQMITQYILIGIARRFAFGGSGMENFSDFGGGINVLGGAGMSGVDFGSTVFSPDNFDIAPFDAFVFRANGGPVSAGSPYVVGERGPELFVPGRSGTIVPNSSLGGDNVSVVVNVDAKGTNVQGNDAAGNQLGRVISAAVQAEIIKQQRPGGVLAGTR